MEEGREERQGIYNIAISKLLQQFIVNAHALCNKKFYNIDHRSSIEAWVESLNRKSGLFWLVFCEFGDNFTNKSTLAIYYSV